ncbi:MAG: pitrilysin family protein [Isosphaeraceae bacterium]|nr:pitrilysin family protein [Isosphaeraceae bacterium]
MHRSPSPRPFDTWAEDLPIVEHRLANGLRVLILPMKFAPVVVCDLYYPVGSFDEPAGQSGIAHFVEHMLFKGTEQRPKGWLDSLTYLSAGQANAETGEDLTHYWFAFPSDRWEPAAAIEADRMAGALFDPAEVEAERQVIVEERARDLDSPFRRLDHQHLLRSYDRHPYRNPILGWPEDLARITADDLRAFHAAHYRPDGAVLVLVGDVRPDRALRVVERTFGAVGKMGGRPGRVEIVEPRQTGRRDFRLEEPESIARAILGWHSTPAGHADEPALELLGDLLGTGRRSRLWDRLVERERLATWVEAAQESSRRAGQFLVQLEATPGSEPKRIEATILRVLEELATDGPTPEELDRVRNQLRSAWLWSREDLDGIAAELGESALWGEWRAWPEHRRALLEVDGEAIRRAAATYLRDQGLTAGWSVPAPSTTSIAVPLPTEARRPQARRVSAAATTVPIDAVPAVRRGPKIDFHPHRSVLSDGMRLLTERRPGTGVVALDFHFDGGRLREAKPGLAYLTGRLLEEGTTSRSADEIAREIEDVGAALDVGSTGISLRIRSDGLAEGIEWIADLALRSIFPEESVDWLKRKIAAEWQSDRDDPAFRAESQFQALIYGDHPFGRDPRGTSRDLARLTREDVATHHATWMNPRNAFLVVVGDFETARLRRLVERAFRGWPTTESTPAPILPRLERTRRPKVRRVFQAGEQVQILIGHLGVTRHEPDFDALRIVDLILGRGPGFTDRLGRILRDEMGLTYSVGGGITDGAEAEPGLFEVSLGTSPDQADLAIRAAMEQIEAMHRGDFSDDEIERARSYLAGSQLFEFQTVEQRAARLVELERLAVPLDEATRLADRLAALEPEAIRRAAARWICPGGLVRVEYGPILPRKSRAIA